MRDFLTSNHPQYPVLSKDLKRLEATKTEKGKKQQEAEEIFSASRLCYLGYFEGKSVFEASPELGIVEKSIEESL